MGHLGSTYREGKWPGAIIPLPSLIDIPPLFWVTGGASRVKTRVEAVQLLDVILAEDRGHIAAAYQASTHLPADLIVHRRKST